MQGLAGSLGVSVSAGVLGLGRVVSVLDGGLSRDGVSVCEVSACGVSV